MKNFTQKFIGLVFLLFAMSFKVNAQDNYSLNFNNNADRVEIPADMLNGLVDFTISSTFKADSGQTGYSCIFQYDPINANNASSMYGRYYQGDNLFEFAYGNAVIDISPVPSFDEWHNIISVCEGGTIKVYLNGDLVGISSYNSSLEFLPSESDILYIGNWNTSENFDGLISDFQIWNKALSNQEINDYINCLPTGNEEGLLGFWNFNEGSGDTVYDLSGNGNHGVINGASYSDDVPEQNCEVSQSDGLVLAEALTEGLIAYYPFNGNANDESSNGNHGEVINATLIDDRFGAPNNAYEFDADYQFTNGGSESYIQLPEISTNIGAPNSSFSISMWFRCYDPSTPGNIILNSGGEGISTIVGRVGVSGNVIDIYHRNPSTNNEPNGSINIDSNWNNVIVIVDGELGEYKLFVNGNIDNSMTFSFDANETYFNEERTWQIGGISYAGSNNHQFHGAIDDISFWGRTLTDDEIHVLSSNNILYGCTILGSPNYNPFANSDDNSCVTYQYLTNSIDSLQTELANLNEQATTSLSSLQQALDTWNTTIDLSAGWNMFGYGCPSSINVADGLSNHTENIIITKDNNGNVYMPEFGFNGIGDLIPGAGYQMKLNQLIDSFSLCDWYVNDIPEDNIVSLQDSIINMHSTNCINDGYCGFDNANQICIAPEQGFDCFGNQILYQVGDLAEGGIVFYVDETGQYGLVSALEDIGQFEWGCWQQEVNGADGTSIGTGYQNTMDIVNQECATENGGLTAAQTALDFEVNGYSDWYLPSIDELVEMYNTIGNGGPKGNIGDFTNSWYWSFTEQNSGYAWHVNFNNGDTDNHNKNDTNKVRPIRSF